MTTDYPDWSRLIQVIGSDIMIPIDIQGAYIMMPVDIQAQYVNLNIDIVAQTVGDINIDIDAQSVGIYLTADWNVLQGNAKSVVFGSSNLASFAQDYADYEVNANKTFWITQVSFEVNAYASEDADKHQMGSVYLKNQTAGIIFCQLGGNGGGAMTLTAPIKVTAGQTVRVVVTNKANHAANIVANYAGFEL